MSSPPQPQVLAPPHQEAEPSLPPFAPDGTDLTVIRWMLACSPEERVRWLESHMQALELLRHARR